MNKLTDKFFETADTGYFTNQDVAALFPDSDDARYALVKRAIANGEIIHLRRGLYCLAPKYRKKSVSQSALAQHIYGPSYISMESALQWHGWIPEAVYTLTSVSFGKSKEFTTPLGVFSYTRVPQEVFYAGVDRVTGEGDDVFFMAAPLKALSDYVYVKRKDWTGLGPVVKSLRVEPEDFDTVASGEYEMLLDNYKSRRVRQFLEGLRKDLKL